MGGQYFILWVYKEKLKSRQMAFSYAFNNNGIAIVQRMNRYANLFVFEISNLGNKLRSWVDFVARW